MRKDFDKVLGFFKVLTTIPRGSKNTAGIRRFLCDFAANRGLDYRADEADNVVIFKAASEGFGAHAPIVLQAHTDMVCAAESGVTFDFLHDALTLEQEGDFLFAKGTSLGADDGIGVAMMLALLDSKEAFPALECIFTANEEIGMLGATALDMSDMKGESLINIDSEDEGVFTVSCAGGSTAVVTLPVTIVPAQGEILDIAVDGLAGGHSGVEIIKGGLNANKLLGEILSKLPLCRIVELGGGEKENAIAARAHMRLLFFEKPLLTALTEQFQTAWREKEPHLTITVKCEGKQTLPALDDESTQRVKRALINMPQGVQKMNAFDTSAVQTSLNLGVIEQSDSRVQFTFSVRSSVEQERTALEKELESIAEKNGGELAPSGVYPAWEYREQSVLRDTAVKVYERLFGKTPRVESIHAGLECGVLTAKKKNLDCISLGPQLYDVHTAKERMSLSSAKRTWEYLTQLLRAL